MTTEGVHKIMAQTPIPERTAMTQDKAASDARAKEQADA